MHKLREQTHTPRSPITQTTAPHHQRHAYLRWALLHRTVVPHLRTCDGALLRTFFNNIGLEGKWTNRVMLVDRITVIFAGSVVYSQANPLPHPHYGCGYVNFPHLLLVAVVFTSLPKFSLILSCIPQLVVHTHWLKMFIADLKIQSHIWAIFYNMLKHGVKLVPHNCARTSAPSVICGYQLTTCRFILLRVRPILTLIEVINIATLYRRLKKWKSKFNLSFLLSSKELKETGVSPFWP